MAQGTFGYPVFLDVSGVSVLVVGGGAVAFRKASGLFDAGAIVTIVAKEIADEMAPRFAAIATTIELRPYRSGEATDYQLVMTATDDPAVNAQVAADARGARVWANSADDPDNCSFILPAVARRGLVTVAVSTGGASPALASRLRNDIADRELTAEVEAAAIELARQRAEIHATGASTEDIDWAPRLESALKPINPPN